MKNRLETHGRAGAMGHGTATVLAILLLVALVGCGARDAGKASTGSASQGAGSQSSSEPAAKSNVAATDAKPAPRPAQAAAGGAVRIILTDHGCVRFEPQWTNVRVGQTVVWHSELKARTTVHVTDGAFDQETFVVRPGATVSAGPTRGVGTFSFWSEPAACRETPRGVLKAGPGVVVQKQS